MNKKNSILKRSKFLIAALTLLFVTAIGVGATIAFLTKETKPLINTFVPGEVTTAVVETFENNIKENVMIENTGNIPAFIRVAVLINWVDSEGNISGKAPKSGEDYSMIFPDESDWFVQGEFYYFKNAVGPGAKTSVLISSIEPKKNKEGYTLQVEILGSGIQSMPSETVEEVWPVKVDSAGNLVELTEGGGL
ncbi:MAG TPA: hypothetical protein VLM88_12545 [Proteiniclasticum sp.]|nr:hypothetical protein [Proteiniclasticum sp.]